MRWIAVGAVALLGVLAGFWAVASDDPAPAPSTHTPKKQADVRPAAGNGSAPSVVRDEALRERVAALEAELATLKRTVASIRRGGPPSSTSGGWIPRAGKAPAETVEADPDSAPEGVKQLVRDEVQQMREDRWGRRESRMVERLEKRLEQFTSDAGLSTSQSKTIGRLLREEQGQLFDALREARKNMSWEDARAKMDALREKTDERVGEALDPEQVPAYEAAREEGLGGPPRRFRRR